jgi:glycine/D-amino acid oxidase-like deaminating enzyme
MSAAENIKLTPLWTDQVTRPENLPTKELPNKVDVAIVGSGYTGLNAALALAEAGAKVAVLEQKTIGWGASSRNGSMLTSGLKAKSKKIKKWYGEELAKYFWDWSVDAVSYVENIVRENQIDCDFSKVGNVYLVSKPSHVDGVKSHGEYLNTQFGYSSTCWIPKEDIQDEIDSEEFHGGLLDSVGCRLHPAKYVFGLAQVVANKSVKLVEHAKVNDI